MNDFLKQVKTRVAKMTSGSAACYDPPVKDVIESYVQVRQIIFDIQDETNNSFYCSASQTSSKVGLRLKQNHQ